MKSWPTSLALFGFGILLGGCALEAQPPGESTGTDEADLSASSRSYVTLTRDQRKCLAPVCGGYFVHDVNRATAPRYVSGLDFTPSGLDPAIVDDTRAAPPEELVLRGKLGPAESAHGTRAFLVYEVYRGMPGRTPAASDAFYFTKDRSPAIQCFAAPCNNLVATKVNTTKKTYFTSYALADVMPWADEDWLASRLEDHGAIAAASIVDGAHLAGGIEQLLHASQVYVRLPDPHAPCPKLPQPSCPTGQVATYMYTTDRCEVFDQCVTPGICPQYIAVCGDGSSLVSWPAAPHACSAFACFPDFILSE